MNDNGPLNVGDVAKLAVVFLEADNILFTTAELCGMRYLRKKWINEELLKRIQRLILLIILSALKQKMVKKWMGLEINLWLAQNRDCYQGILNETIKDTPADRWQLTMEELDKDADVFMVSTIMSVKPKQFSEFIKKGEYSAKDVFGDMKFYDFVKSWRGSLDA